MTIYESVARRFSPPEFITLPEFVLVEARRRLDAIAFCPWPSRGFPLVGFDFKEQRQDWLNELKGGVKTEESAAFCDQFWLVSPKDIIRPDEVPEGFGFLEKRGDRLFQIVEAPERRAVPLTKAVLARFVDRLSDMNNSREYQLRSEIRKSILKELMDTDASALTKAREETQALRDTIKIFEDASGIMINRWDTTGLKKVGSVVRALRGVPNGLSVVHQIQAAENYIRLLKQAEKEVESFAVTVD